MALKIDAALSGILHASHAQMASGSEAHPPLNKLVLAPGLVQGSLDTKASALTDACRWVAEGLQLLTKTLSHHSGCSEDSLMSSELNEE